MPNVLRGALASHMGCACAIMMAKRQKCPDLDKNHRKTVAWPDVIPAVYLLEGASKRIIWRLGYPLGERLPPPKRLEHVMRHFAAISSLATLLSATVLISPALAQDDSATPFQGPSATAIVGVDNGRSFGRDATGVVYGVQAGYDWQLGQTVLGIEGEITGASTRNCFPGGVAAGDRFCEKADRDLYIGSRLGRVVGTSTLLYVKGGYTNARTSFDYTDGAAGVNNYTGSGVQGGIRGGAGVEHKIGPNVSLKAEYRYSNYSNSDYSRHQGVVGVGFHF